MERKHLLEVNVEIHSHLPKQSCIRFCCSLVTERLCWHSRQVSTSSPLLETEEHPTTNNKGPHLEEDVCSLSGLSCVMTEVALSTKGYCKRPIEA